MEICYETTEKSLVWIRSAVTCPSIASRNGDDCSYEVLLSFLTRSHINKYTKLSLYPEGKQPKQVYPSSEGSLQVASNPSYSCRQSADLIPFGKLPNEEIIDILESAGDHHRDELHRILDDSARTLDPQPGRPAGDDTPLPPAKDPSGKSLS